MAWTSIVLALVFLVVYAMNVRALPLGDQAFISALLRWAHVASGIMWIGHLYYFNFTQIPNAPKIPEEHRGPSVAKVIAPAALFWFRWGAVATLVTGLLLAYNEGYLVDALTFTAFTTDHPTKSLFIGIGMWLAIIMFINVWAVIWPAQQRALNIDNKYPSLDPAAKAAAAKTAMMFSRTNTLLSLPMLVAMTGAQTLG